MTIKVKLDGDSMQVATVQLDPGAARCTPRPASSSGRPSTSVVETRLTKPSDGAGSPGSPGAQARPVVGQAS